MPKKKKESEIYKLKHQIVIDTDGTCAGNPGLMGVGGIITQNYPVKKVLCKFSKPFGYGTNNEAEYLAIICCLEEYIKLNIKSDSVLIHSDSKVIVNQINGNLNINHIKLAKLRKKVIKLSNEIPCEVCIEWISRKQNKVADELAGKCIEPKFLLCSDI